MGPGSRVKGQGEDPWLGIDTNLGLLDNVPHVTTRDGIHPSSGFVQVDNLGVAYIKGGFMPRVESRLLCEGQGC